MNTETKTIPLWKELKNKISPQRWIVNGTSKSLQRLHIAQTFEDQTENLMSVFTSIPEAEANAAYTVLAVNNLAKLAEALEKMCEWHEKQATWDKGDNGYYQAKEALQSIR